jgi:hypothetical protein
VERRHDGDALAGPEPDLHDAGVVETAVLAPLADEEVL